MFTVIGGVLLAVGIMLLFSRRKDREDLLEIKYIKQSKISDLIENSKEIQKRLDEKDAYRQTVEVRGNVICEKPLIAELSGEKCIFFSRIIEEEYEEIYHVEDDDGSRQQKKRIDTRVVSKIDRYVDFKVNDGSGEITVIPEGADIDSFQIFEDYKPYDGDIEYTSGNYKYTPTHLDRGKDRAVLGYRFSEFVLPIDQSVYVLGETGNEDDNLVIRKSREKDKPYIISNRSEEELVNEKDTAVTVKLVVAIILLAVGGFLIVGTNI